MPIDAKMTRLFQWEIIVLLLIDSFFQLDFISFQNVRGKFLGPVFCLKNTNNLVRREGRAGVLQNLHVPCFIPAKSKFPGL